jgi:hypothetical protein
LTYLLQNTVAEAFEPRRPAIRPGWKAWATELHNRLMMPTEARARTSGG